MLTFIASPYQAKTPAGLVTNISYARAATRHSFFLGEHPFTPHLLYTQEGILQDAIPEDRALGLSAGKAWLKRAERLAVYKDFGISEGMREEITLAHKIGLEIVFRYLPKAFHVPGLGLAFTAIFALGAPGPALAAIFALGLPPC